MKTEHTKELHKDKLTMRFHVVINDISERIHGKMAQGINNLFKCNNVKHLSVMLS